MRSAMCCFRIAVMRGGYRFKQAVNAINMEGTRIAGGAENRKSC